MNRNGVIFNIQEYAVHDGAGIRTAVFLKGCHLRCAWCCNPEGQEYSPEIFFNKSLCSRCRKCECAKKSISFSDMGYPLFKKNICLSCADKSCEESCPYSAIKIIGKSYTAKTLYNKVISNLLFFKNSGGGITLSGGEPLAQPAFVRDFLKLCEAPQLPIRGFSGFKIPSWSESCSEKSFLYTSTNIASRSMGKKTGLSIGVETCGCFEWEKVKDFIAEFDFYYFDIKTTDPEKHKCFTGKDNKLILENLKKLAKINPSKITVTIAIIPGVNNSEKAVSGIIKICKENKILKIRLLPYHFLGKDKYEALGRKYPMKNTNLLKHSEMEHIKNVILKSGIKCWIE